MTQISSGRVLHYNFFLFTLGTFFLSVLTLVILLLGPMERSRKVLIKFTFFLFLKHIYLLYFLFNNL